MKLLRKISPMLLTTALCYLAVLTNPAESFDDKQAANMEVIGSVGTYNITLEDFLERYQNYLNATGIKDNPFTRRAILNNIVNEILLEKYDDKSKILKDKIYKIEIEWAKKQTVLAYLKDQEIYAKITVTENQLREAFERSNEKLSARHLYAATEEEANNLYNLLQIGVGFDILAKQVFTDTTLRNNGGYLGYFSLGDMDPAFEEIAYSLAVGETSAPVKTAYGYSIIKLEDRVKHPLLTETEFLQKRPHLERSLKIKMKKSYEKEYLKKIYDHKKISFKQKSIEELFKIINNRSAENFEKRKTKTSNSLCAMYAGKSYSQKDILKKINDIPQYHKEKITSPEKLQAAIEGFIIQEKLLGMAKSKGYDTLSVMLDAYNKLSEYIYLNFKRSEITYNAKLPDSVIFNYYQENTRQFSTEDELNVQEIIVDNENLADSLKLLVSGGNDFGELAKNYSIRKWSAENNGIMGFAPLSKFGMLKEKFLNADVGQLIGPVAIGNYYGLFKVLEKKQGKPNEYNLVKNQVTQTLKFEQKTKIVSDYLDNLRKKIHIEINENILNTYKFE